MVDMVKKNVLSFWLPMFLVVGVLTAMMVVLGLNAGPAYAAEQPAMSVTIDNADTLPGLDLAVYPDFDKSPMAAFGPSVTLLEVVAAPSIDTTVYTATFVVTVPPFSTGTGNTINAITDENRLSMAKNISMAVDPFAESGNPNVMGTTTGFFTEATRSGDITFRDQQGSDWQAAMHQNRLTTVETNAAIDERATSTAFLAGRVVSDSYMLSGSRPQLTTAFSLV